jgi:hypothetical protein
MICASLFAIGVTLAPDVVRSAAATAQVTFVVNDAFVKDKMLAGVEIRRAGKGGETPTLLGKTDADGRLSVDLVPGTHLISYALAGYVPIDNTPVEIGTTPEVVTTTLSMLLESEGKTEVRRIRIILNWGNDPAHVKDVDSHLLCACAQSEPHVYFGAKSHRVEVSLRQPTALAHATELDVDDMDWGGPETVTIADPPPGEYLYWVHNYSGNALLGSSAVVVRVVVGDAVAGEYRIPRELLALDWRPFAAIRVDERLVTTVEPFTPEQLAAREDQAAPGQSPELVQDIIDDSCGGGAIVVVILALGLLPIAVGRYVASRKRR